MAFCSRCGTPVPGEARFCPGCGQAVAAFEAQPAAAEPVQQQPEAVLEQVEQVSPESQVPPAEVNTQQGYYAETQPQAQHPQAPQPQQSYYAQPQAPQQPQPQTPQQNYYAQAQNQNPQQNYYAQQPQAPQPQQSYYAQPQAPQQSYYAQPQNTNPQQNYNAQQQYGYQQQQYGYQQQGAARQSGPADIEENKGISVLCYLGILILIPLLSKPNSAYVRYHSNQGLLLIIMSIVLWILFLIPYVGWYLLGPIGSIFTFVCLIMGIINAASGHMKPLPLIGKITLIK